MANWQYKISFKDFYDDQEMPIEQKAKKVSIRLENVRKRMLKNTDEEILYYAEQLEEVVEAFKFLSPSSDELEEMEEFDGWMRELYDIADSPISNANSEHVSYCYKKKLLWIETQ